MELREGTLEKMLPKSNCSLYLLIAPWDLQPRYVGITCRGRSRPEKHFRKARAGVHDNEHLQACILKGGGTLIVDILYTGLTWEEAQALEIWWISIYGRSDKGRGPLCNHTDGGEGTLGFTRSKESEARRIKSMLNTLATPGRIEPRRGKRRSKESIVKREITNALKRAEPGYVHPRKNKPLSPEHKKNAMAGLNTMRATPGWADPKKGRRLSSEHIERAKIGQAKKFSDPNFVHPLKGRKRPAEAIEKGRQTTLAAHALPGWIDPKKGRKVKK